MTRIRILTVLAVVFLGVWLLSGAPPAAAQEMVSTGTTIEGEVHQDTGPGFLEVVRASGWLGIMLWLAILGTLGWGVYVFVDCCISVRAPKIMPQSLIDRVTESMEQGDILKALSNCEDEPGPMANILTAGFSHVEEGFETIQEAVGVSAELESEKLMQQITYLSVVGSIAPMLGLLGTVQGMIRAFAHLSAMGAAMIGVLAKDISQALYTTAAGLSIAVPVIAAYFFFRNKANRIILRMEAITLDLIKDLRNVEVVEE